MKDLIINSEEAYHILTFNINDSYGFEMFTNTKEVKQVSDVLGSKEIWVEFKDRENSTFKTIELEKLLKTIPEFKQYRL